MATQAKTYPDFSRPQPRDVVWRMAELAYEPDPALERLMEPAYDSRYPGYAGPMEDARYGTDYRPHCSSNIPPPFQFSSKKWIINNGDYIMNESRKRQAEYTGAALVGRNQPMPMPGFANVAGCTPFICEMRDTPDDNHVRIGLYRGDGGAPALFGTFTVEPTRAESVLGMRKNIGITTQYEGGRNTPRGNRRYLHGAG